MSMQSSELGKHLRSIGIGSLIVGVASVGLQPVLAVAEDIAAEPMAAAVLSASEQTTKQSVAAPLVWVKRYSDTATKIRWKKISKADGYVIYRFDTVKQKYVKVKTLKSSQTVWIDRNLKTRTVYKYVVKAFRAAKASGKRMYSEASLWVSARTYHRGDKRVNAGEVVANPLTMAVGVADSIDYHGRAVATSDRSLDYHDAAFGAYKWGTRVNKKVIDSKLRFVQLSGFDIATVSITGDVSAPKKTGKVKIRVVAHNGNSTTSTITVNDYAHPKSFDLDDTTIMPAAQQLLKEHSKELTAIADFIARSGQGYKMKFSLDEESQLVSSVPLSTAEKDLIFGLLDDFPYELTIDHSWGVTFHVFQTYTSGRVGESIIVYHPWLEAANAKNQKPASHWYTFGPNDFTEYSPAGFTKPTKEISR